MGKGIRIKPFADRWSRALASLALIAALAGLVGCSTAAMESNPIWDDGASGKREDRINVWPIFYYSPPNLSVAWPLFAMTPSGHALIPVYESREDGDELRLLTVHPWIPAGIQHTGADGYTRVANIFYNDRNSLFSVFPIFFHYFDDNATVLFPIFWRSPEEKILALIPAFAKTENGVWTPLYTHYPDFKGVLGPLFFMDRDGDDVSYHYPFPLVSNWKKGEESGFRITPLVYWKRGADSTKFNLALLLADYARTGDTVKFKTDLGLLASYERTGDDLEFQLGLALLAYYKRTGDETSYSYLALLGGGQKKPKEEADYFLPLWIRGWEEIDGKKYKSFYSIPYTHSRDVDSEYRSIAQIGYIASDKGDSRYRSLLFPLLHWYENEKEKGHAVLPLYDYSKSKEGVTEFISLPLTFRSDGSLLDVGAFLYVDHENENRRFRSLVWPLTGWSKRKDGWSAWLLPFIYRLHEEAGGDLLVTPLGGGIRDPDGEYADVLGPLYYHQKVNGGTYRTVAFPLIHTYRDKQRTWSALFPLFLYDQFGEERAFYSIPLSVGKTADGSFFNLGLLLYNHFKTDDSRKYYFLFPFIATEYTLSLDYRKSYAFPIFRRESGPKYGSFLSVVYGSEGRKGGLKAVMEDIRSDVALMEVSEEVAASELEERWDLERHDGTRQTSLNVKSRFFLLGLAGSNLDLIATYRPPPEDSTAEETDGMDRVSIQKNRSSYLFPLYSADSVEGEALDLDVLWRVYNSSTYIDRDTGLKHGERRFLWQVYHDELRGDSRSVDVFPFIAYDHRPDFKQWSFAGGLFGYRKEAGRRSVKFLYITFGGKSPSAKAEES